MKLKFQPLLVCCFLFSFLAVANDVIEQEYDPALADVWRFSGYVKVLADVSTDHSKAELELDDLSVFISAEVSDWFNPFVEAEYFSGTLWQNKGNAKLDDGHFIFERLYNDFHLDDDNRIRVGKFLAPVGFWNLTHAAPLVWSINRPFSSTAGFSNYITGIGFGHSIDALSGSRVDGYLQLTDEFNPKPLFKHPRRYNKVFGLSWTLADELEGRSSVDFQYAQTKETNAIRTTISFHQAWYLQHWDIDTQLIYTDVKAGDVNPFEPATDFADADGWDGGGYVQLRYRISHQLNLYVRDEYFHFAAVRDAGNKLIVGGRYRLGSWGNLNIEYQFGAGTQAINQDGLSLSYNAMFR